MNNKRTHTHTLVKFDFENLNLWPTDYDKYLKRFGLNNKDEYTSPSTLMNNNEDCSEIQTDSVNIIAFFLWRCS